MGEKQQIKDDEKPDEVCASRAPIFGCGCSELLSRVCECRWFDSAKAEVDLALLQNSQYL